MRVQSIIAQHVKMCQSQCIQHVRSIDEMVLVKMRSLTLYHDFNR